jgi:hypothetical protein
MFTVNLNNAINSNVSLQRMHTLFLLSFAKIKSVEYTMPPETQIQRHSHSSPWPIHSDQVVTRYEPTISNATSVTVDYLSFPPSIILNTKHSQDIMLGKTKFLWYLRRVRVLCSS